MSTPLGGPRRRRIAGERRPRTLPGEPQAPQPLDETTTDRATEPTPKPTPKPPVDLSKPAEASPKRGEASPKRGETSLKRGETSLKTGGPAPEPVEPAPTAEPARRTSGWGSRLSLIVLGAALALVLVLTGLTALGLLGTDGVADVQETEAVQEARRTAPATAEAAAAAILAYDHKSLEADKENAVGFMTDEFAEEYSTTFDKVVSPAAEENRATVTASVLASSVIRATEDSARVLIFVDQSTVSRANERPQIALNRVVMTMERVDGSWLVSDISSY